jgi:hypothetical protein
MSGRDLFLQRREPTGNQPVHRLLVDTRAESALGEDANLYCLEAFHIRES